MLAAREEQNAQTSLLHARYFSFALRTDETTRARPSHFIIKRAARVPSNLFLIHSLQVNVIDIAESQHTKVLDVMTGGGQG